MSNISTDEQPTDTGRGFPRWLKWGLLGALAVVIVGYGLIFLYAKVLNDSPDELDEGDLAAALADDPSDESAGDEPSDEPAGDDPAGDEPSDEPAGDEETVDPTDTRPEVAPDTTAVEAEAPPATEAAPADEASPAGSAGTWEVTDASELGYRVKEILFGVDTEGVGRTNQITGALTIEGTTLTDAEFVVDVATIESDDGRRDNQFRGRIMSTDEFPTATFTLTEPVELGTEAVEGATVAASATGELTLRGVTNTVTFDLSARLENGKIGVLGNIPVVFADYSIANPSTGGITTEDTGLLEFVLVFEPAA